MNGNTSNKGRKNKNAVRELLLFGAVLLGCFLVFGVLIVTTENAEERRTSRALELLDGKYENSPEFCYTVYTTIITPNGKVEFPEEDYGDRVDLLYATTDEVYFFCTEEIGGIDYYHIYKSDYSFVSFESLALIEKIYYAPQMLNESEVLLVESNEAKNHHLYNLKSKELKEVERETVLRYRYQPDVFFNNDVLIDTVTGEKLVFDDEKVAELVSSQELLSDLNEEFKVKLSKAEIRGEQVYLYFFVSHLCIIYELDFETETLTFCEWVCNSLGYEEMTLHKQ